MAACRERERKRAHCRVWSAQPARVHACHPRSPSTPCPFDDVPCPLTTPLRMRQGHTTLVRALLGAGADMQTTDLNGQTALMYATAVGHEEVIDALVAAGAEGLKSLPPTGAMPMPMTPPSRVMKRGKKKKVGQAGRAAWHRLPRAPRASGEGPGAMCRHCPSYTLVFTLALLAPHLAGCQAQKG